MPAGTGTGNSPLHILGINRFCVGRPYATLCMGGRREGCLSVPDYTGHVARAARIRVRCQDGAPREYRCEGYEASAVLHEIDHLDGLLFLDRVESPRSDLFRRKNYK